MQSVLFSEVSLTGAIGPPLHNDAMRAKRLGAYYTNSQVADRLTEWAVRSGNDTIVDPSFGGGVFLRAASKRVINLNGNPRGKILGVELDREVHARIGKQLKQEFDLGSDDLILSDFFDLPPAALQVDAVIGNPPFIRFHRFAEAGRTAALARALESGVRLSKLTSSWAPFIVHACSMLKEGGRLAMVVPAEIGYAAYASPLLRHLEDSFATISLLSFREKLFRDLNEDTFLLLADGYRQKHLSSRILDYNDIGRLSFVQNEPRNADLETALALDDLARGRGRLIEAYLDPGIRRLYVELRTASCVATLGGLAEVGIGYVTGGNGFFHLTPSQASYWQIPEQYLRRAILKGRALKGLAITEKDWSQALAAGDAGLLLSTAAKEADVPDGVRRYLSHGRARGVPSGYKCRQRDPWYSVPNVYQPDAFLTYMSGRMPKMAANRIGAVAPNTLHTVRMREGTRGALGSLMVGWNSSLTRLSIEIEGHGLGGGMLKLEPSEADRLLVPLSCEERIEDSCQVLDGLTREGRVSAARDLADEITLIKGLGLSRADCQSMNRAAEDLARRRMSKGAAR